MSPTTNARSSGAGLAALLAAVLAGGALTVAPAAAAETATASRAKAAAAPAPKFLSADQASLRARQSGKPVVASALTTSMAQTVANPNGTLTLTQTVAPTRVFRNGAWTGLDGTLKANPDGTFSPAATTDQVVLSGGGRGPLARMYAGGEGFTLTLPLSLPHPSVSDDTAVYANVIPGVDLTVTVSDAGAVSDVFTVRNAAAAHDPRLLQLLDATATPTRGLHVAADKAGDLAVADAKGRAVFAAPVPTAWDSAKTALPRAAVRDGDPIDPASSADNPGHGSHRAQLGVAVAKGKVDLTVPSSLLAGNPVYPLFIDPTYSPSYGVGKNGWSSPGSGVPTQNFWNGTVDYGVGDSDAEVGNSGDVQGEAMSIFNLPVPLNLKGAQIYSANFGIDENYSWACLTSGHNQSVDLYAPSQTLNSGNATWNNWVNSLGSQVAPSESYALGYSSSCPGNGVPAYPLSTSLVTNDINAGKGLQTFVLRADDHSDNYAFKEFTPSSAQWTITYDFAPNIPTGLSTSPAANCNGGTTLGDTSVSLFAPVSTPTNSSLTTTFTMWKTTDNTNKTNLLTSANGVASNTFKNASGQDAVMPLPESFFAKLAGGASTGFAWTVSTSDGTLTTASKTTCSFMWDPTRPGAPGIAPDETPDAGAQTCATRGDSNDANQAIGTTCEFTLSQPTVNSGGTVTKTSVSGYVYQVNQQPPVTVQSTGSINVRVSLTHLVNTLTVSALSAGGNVGSPTAVWFDGTAINPPANDGDLSLDGTPDLIVPGNNGPFGPGLWLAEGNSDGTVTNTPANIGVDGLDFTSPATPTDWNGAQAITGSFCGDGAQDVMAYFPSGNNAGGGEVACNDGSGDPLHIGQPTTDLTDQAPYRIFGGTLIDDNSDIATQVAAGGNTSGQSTGLPDLLATAGNANTGYQLIVYFSHTANGYGDPFGCSTGDTCYQLSGLNSPDGTMDWNAWTITTAQLSSGTAMYLWNSSTGELDLWTGLKVDSTGTTLTTTGQYQIATGWNKNPTDNLILRAADIAGNGIPDLWVTDTTTGTTTATLPGALTSDPTLTTATTPLKTSAHAWDFQDIGSNSPGTPITATNDNPSGSAPALSLTGTAGATWNTGDMFSPDADLDGSTGSLNTTGPAVTTSQDFTVSAWVNPQAVTSAGGAVLSQDGSHNSGFVLFASPSGWQFCMAKADTGPWNDDCAASTIGVHLGAWIHLTATYDHNTGKTALYLNGVSDASGTHTAVTGFTGKFQVGKDLLNSAANAYFNGTVSQVQTWNQTLTPAQVYAVYAGSTKAANSTSMGATVLASDNTLYPSGSTWTHGVQTLAFNHGLLTITSAGTQMFSAGNAGYPGAVLTLQSDGNLVIYDTAADARAHTGSLWATGTYGSPSDTGDAVVFQPDAQLVVYDADGTPLWTSETDDNGANQWLLNGTGLDAASVNSLSPANVTWGTDHNGTTGAAAVLNGTSSVLRAPSPAVSTTWSYTVSAWVKLSNLATTQTVVSQATNNHQAFYLGYDQSKNAWYYMTTTSDSSTTTYPEVSGGWAQAGQWTHLTATYEIATHLMTLYVNGVSVGTTTDTSPVASVGPLQIGANSLPATPTSLYNATTGSVSDVRAYPVAISPSQVQMDTSLPNGQSHYTFADTVDWYGNHAQDLVAADSSGKLWVIPTGQHTSNPTRTQIGSATNWSSYTIAGIADLDKDGNLDVIARDANGLLWDFPGNSNHDLASKVQIGSGWSTYSFAGVRDWNGDGKPDVVAKDSSGVLWLYPGTGTVNGLNSLGTHVQIGTSWTSMTLDGMTDWNNDGHMDLLATDSNGALWLYAGDAAHDTSGGRTQIGTGWASYNIVGLQNVTGDPNNNPDVITRDSSNTLYVYPGDGTISTGTLGTPRNPVGVNW
ncbi:LamG-like jellyroll fold domain-containing protein [Streptacidiphilus neutrinimicus]|uniref:LamG-like jellyroll fold domain-containing protein n=1 Tax=Streptacidiphilus neutrinimicus TaxID=105420 RepID=UPI00126A6F81|nr:LamG-like jellyroll fold domain-containing protein [Streptacidiphilus neutrinimicus]